MIVATPEERRTLNHFQPEAMRPESQAESTEIRTGAFSCAIRSALYLV